jgi:hypothetical protein
VAPAHSPQDYGLGRGAEESLDEAGDDGRLEHLSHGRANKIQSTLAWALSWAWAFSCSERGDIRYRHYWLRLGIVGMLGKAA